MVSMGINRVSALIDVQMSRLMQLPDAVIYLEDFLVRIVEVLE